MSLYPKSKKVRTKPYSIWLAMKTRCYVTTAANYKNYGAKGVTVCDSWKDDFQAFAKWYVGECVKLGIDPETHNYELDKDILSAANNISPAIYSPDTCKLVSRQVNSNHKQSTTKSFNLIDSEGNEVTVTNLKVFSETNNLSYNSMRSVVSGRMKQHKGYRLRDS